MVVFLTIPNLGHFNDHTWWWSRFTGFHFVSHFQTTHMNMPSPYLNLLLHQIDHYENVAGLSVVPTNPHQKCRWNALPNLVGIESDYKWMLLLHFSDPIGRNRSHLLIFNLGFKVYPKWIAPFELANSWKPWILGECHGISLFSDTQLAFTVT